MQSVLRDYIDVKSVVGNTSNDLLNDSAHILCHFASDRMNGVDFFAQVIEPEDVLSVAELFLNVTYDHMLFIDCSAFCLWWMLNSNIHYPSERSRIEHAIAILLTTEKFLTTISTIRSPELDVSSSRSLIKVTEYLSWMLIMNYIDNEYQLYTNSELNTVESCQRNIVKSICNNIFHNRPDVSFYLSKRYDHLSELLTHLQNGETDFNLSLILDLLTRSRAYFEDSCLTAVSDRCSRMCGTDVLWNKFIHTIVQRNSDKMDSSSQHKLMDFVSKRTSAEELQYLDRLWWPGSKYLQTRYPRLSKHLFMAVITGKFTDLSIATR